MLFAESTYANYSVCSFLIHPVQGVPKKYTTSNQIRLIMANLNLKGYTFLGHPVSILYTNVILVT